MNTLSAGWLLWAALVGLADPAPSPGTSAPVPGGAVQVSGVCPTQAAVIATLSSVLDADTLRRTPDPARVVDLGDRYVVEAAGQRGSYADSARDCGERARVAAVFIALALNPPVAPAASPPSVPSPGPPSPPAPLPPPDEPARSAPRPTPARAWREISAAGRIDVAVAQEDAPGGATAGPELRVAAGKGAWGLAVTGGALWPTTASYATVSVRQQRFPFGVALVFKKAVGSSLELGVEGGLALALMRLQAHDIQANDPSTRVDAGARLVFGAAWPRGDGWAIFAALRGEIFPRVYVLDVDPLKKVGATHHYWWGASLGISFAAP